MSENSKRQLKLGMHTYTLHFFGFCESGDSRDDRPGRVMSLEELMDKAVEWELDGLHITKVDLVTIDDENLSKVKKDAEDRGLFLEFNSSFDSENDSRINCTIEEALEIGHKLACQLVKFSLDVKRDRILYGSCMNPEIMKQLVEKYEIFHGAIPMIEEYGMKIAIENHTDTFADEVMWLVDKLNHPLIGACVDTCNPMRVIDNPYYTMERMLPKAYCCHFSDDIIVVDSLGVRDIGAAHGQGSLDCPKMVQQILEKSPMDTIIFENEIALERFDEPIEEARVREMKACEDSVRYLRDVLKLGVRNR
ncbi:sugar phosphate isomerase/epimerase family protein [Desulforhopalus singaporensis]|uniref:Sugar phosphate isomerase/epimerase n=1 Tax=Desulforhopalus singaporensis TaxID=91360 RepID=A0A1H0VYA5_9BACT|nr:TIM barrel protein [Desulforhopalus singaporensis]SDP83507.1 Sugar phosphate isomerase/epimerase [Desulforhopalus singaporensis]